MANAKWTLVQFEKSFPMVYQNQKQVTFGSDMRLLALVFLLLSSLPACAQFTLTGKVVETNTDEPLPFATIILKSSGKGAITNTDGYFTLPNTPSDTATIGISYIGYNARQIKLSVDILKQGKLIIQMEPSSATLTAVEVKADAFQFVNVTHFFRLRERHCVL